MDEEQDPVATPDCGVVAAHERWAYGQGWAAGLTEGRRQASTRATAWASTPAPTSARPAC